MVMPIDTLPVEPLTAAAFAEFGDVIEPASAKAVYAVNDGTAQRFHDLATVDTGSDGGRTLVSIFRAQPRPLPFTIRMLERHPLGSQAFIPLSGHPFLVVVAEETPDGPGEPLAFRTRPGQGVNIGRNVWHGILTPLDGVSDFAVVDRGGEGVNLEEHFFDEPFLIR